MDLSQYSEEQLAYIIKTKDETNLSWTEIAEKYNKKFKENKYCESLRKCYHRNKHYFDQKDAPIKTLKQIQQTKKNSSNVAKENKIIIDHLLSQDSIIEAIQNAVKEISLTKYKIPKPISKDNKKEKMTLEALLSDIHFGKLVKNEQGKIVINSEEIRVRLKKMSDQIIKEIQRNKEHFNVERLIVSCLGDLIENSSMHNIESLKGCEFGTSRQVFECIQSLYSDFFLPLALTGIKIDVIAITGNHDRNGDSQTYVNRGEDNLSFIIFKTLQLLCKNSNLTNMDFNISIKIYNHTKVYGNTILLEHGDEIRSLDRNVLTTMMNKRQSQINQIVHFYRIGHFHEPIILGQGKIMVNGSITGSDGYSDGKGYSSEALQFLNYYVETNKRKTCYFKNFPIYLEEIKK